MNEENLQKILSEFDAPELFYVEHKYSGPDENLYLFKDQAGNQYGLWARDYMSELELEAEGLKNDLGINVKNWVKLKADDEYVAEKDGDNFALFKY